MKLLIVMFLVLSSAAAFAESSSLDLKLSNGDTVETKRVCDSGLFETISCSAQNPKIIFYCDSIFLVARVNGVDTRIDDPKKFERSGNPEECAVLAGRLNKFFNPAK
jgi:hypothetical protein